MRADYAKHPAQHAAAQTDGVLRRKAARRPSSVLPAMMALGWGAPVRVAYELSKRLGGHSLLFGRLARYPASGGFVASPFPACSIADLRPERREATLSECEEIVQGIVRIFGERFDTGWPPDWHAAVHVPGRWGNQRWWDIDLRFDGPPGSDVKWVWELNRHRHLVVLARAVAVDPNCERWSKALAHGIGSWLATNPPEQGVNWYSNLEIALRSISWLQVLSLAGPKLPDTTTRRMSDVLYRSGQHLVRDLAYTLSSMRNNHLLGDALALSALGRSFPGDRRANRWRVLGDRLFANQLRRQVHANGSMIEDSVSYHRFSLELLVLKLLLGGATAAEVRATRSAAGFLCRLGAMDGSVPAYGDGDESRALVSSGERGSLRGSVVAALSAAGTGSSDGWRESYDEAAWYWPVGEAAAAEAAETEGREVGGGIARAARGPFVCWLKGGSAPSHGHADLTSVAVSFDSEWVVGDPGTGSYNRSDEERGYFRSSRAHDVLRVGGADQFIGVSRFRWHRPSSGAVRPPLKLDDCVVMWGFHGAYTRLSPPRRVCRAVICSLRSVTVVDWVEGPQGFPYEISLPLGPTVQWRNGTLRMKMGRFLMFQSTSVVHHLLGNPTESVVACWSPSYGKLLPTTVLVMSGSAAGPIVWQLSTGEPLPATEGDAVVTPGGRRLSVRWGASEPRLIVPR